MNLYEDVRVRTRNINWKGQQGVEVEVNLHVSKSDFLSDKDKMECKSVDEARQLVQDMTKRLTDELVAEIEASIPSAVKVTRELANQ